MKNTVLVFVFGGLGSVLRYWIGLVSIRYLGTHFPTGTLTVNIIGCTLIGILAQTIPLPQVLSSQIEHHDLRLMLITGLCGGFTTFSAFSLDAANLWMRGEAGLAVFYVAASVVLSLTGVAIGLMIGKALTS